MSKKYDWAIVIGRFQPLHHGHVELIRKALSVADNVLVLVGSATSPTTIKNPFTYEQRKNMIKEVFPKGVNVCGISDSMYNNDEWTANVQEAVEWAIPQSGKKQICLVGHEKDETSFYLEFFPQWDRIEVPLLVNGINATYIRERMFQTGMVPTATAPKAICNFLFDWLTHESYRKCKRDWEYKEAYKEEAKRYPRVEHTVDAIVEQSGHVLLCRRAKVHEEAHNPGADLWALPGGFLEPNETLLQGAIRELKEETNLRIPEPVLLGSMVNRKTFDDPKRELLRGRIITECFHFKLKDGYTLPEVRGSDDVAEAKWFTLAEIKGMRREMYSDHLDIIKTMLGI